MIFEEISKKWLNEKKAYVKLSTYAYYEYAVQHYIIPALGDKLLIDITEELVQQTVLFWQMKDQCDKTLKKSTIKNLVMLIKQILKYAAKKKYISNMLMDIRYLPQSTKNKPFVFSREEELMIIQAILDELSYKTFGILLCFNSGMRIGEICAIKWSDIDISNRIIHVNKTLQRIYNKNDTPKSRIIITSPKTETSNRDIPLSQKLYDTIKQFKDINYDGYILSNTSCYMEPHALRTFYVHFLNKHNINVLRFHCIRHTFATRCIENGADYKTVSEILGHTTINTTMNMYVHPLMKEKQRCVDMLKWE